MITRIPHKIRIPLTYLPLGLNMLIGWTFLFIKMFNYSEFPSLTFIEVIRITMNSSGFLLFMKAILLTSPSLFTLAQLLYLLIQISVISRKDKKDHTKILDSYFDEMYKENLKKGIRTALYFFIPAFTILIGVFILTNIIGRTFFHLMASASILLCLAIIIFCISFVYHEEKLARAYNDDIQETDNV